VKVPVGQDLWPRPLVPIGWNMAVTLSLAVNKLPQADAPRYPWRGALLPVSNTSTVQLHAVQGKYIDPRAKTCLRDGTWEFFETV
jgi:hypothetical protein